MTQKNQKDNLTVLRIFAALCAVFLMLSSATARAETNVCNAGIGGTGIQQDGIGGTGIQANSGVGGTGIVGIVTGFASICVNGLEVLYNKQTEVDVDGVASSIDALNIGQLVAIESSKKSNQLVAQRVSIAHMMIGKIEKVDLAQNTLQVMGKTINLSTETIVSADLKPQLLVKISGLVAANNRVLASRIDLAQPNTPSQVAGLVDKAGAINGVNITSVNKIQTGSMVRVSGRWDGRKLQANEMKESAIQRVLDGAKNVIIQDFATSAQQAIKLQNQIISIDKHTKVSGKNSSQNQTIIVYGRSDRAGKINAHSVEYTNENKMLERGGSKHRPDTSNKSNSSEERIEQERTKEVKDRLDKLETAEHPEKIERSEKTEKVERPEKIEHSEKTERLEKLEHLEKAERPQRHEGRDYLF
jgi:Domain of unknown function (DUF5666)